MTTTFNPHPYPLENTPIGGIIQIHSLLCRGRIQRKTWCMGPYAGVDYNLTLCPLQSQLQRIYHGQPYARVYLNHIPESTFLSPSHGLWIWLSRGRCSFFQ
jgi:hypothetical protein